MESILHRCPRCKRPVSIDVRYSEDEIYGESAILKVRCHRCNKDTSIDLIKGLEVADLVDALHQ